MRSLVKLFGALGLVASLAASKLSAKEAIPTFNKDIRPILAEYCFNCHGQDAGSRKAGLRLDVREDALKGGKSGRPGIAPGQSQASELVARILSTDPDALMPPPDSGKVLSKEAIATLRKWIENGAHYEAHWAFIPPTRPELSSKKGHPIDLLVEAKLRERKLSPSAPADRTALLRRLALDLTGIPPTPAEVDSFVADKSPDAYDKVVEGLLSSPRFGEKWARHWLDAARYADSDGFEKDLPRNQWPWRDWVINAINRDMPYDQFLIEQLAGDLLPEATQDQQIATGFLRNGMVNEEGAIIAEEFRIQGVIDRMDALGKSVLGITLQCAQCHTHKFDPLTHKEYYGLFAFINNDYEKTSWIFTDEEQKTIKAIQEKVNKYEEEIQTQHPDWMVRIRDWGIAARTNLVSWKTLDASEYKVIGGISHPEKLADKSILTLGFRLANGELYVVTTNPPADIKGIRLDALTHGDLPFNGPGRSYKGTFAISELVVEAANLGSNNWRKLDLTNAVAEFEEAQRPLEETFKKANENRVVGPASFMIDGKDETAWGADRGRFLRHQDISWAAQFSPSNNWPTGPMQMKVTFKFRHGGDDPHGRENNLLGRFKLSVSSEPSPTREILPWSIRRILAVPIAERTLEHRLELFSYWRSTVPDFKEINDKIAAAWREYPKGDSILNLAERKEEWARRTYVLDRGMWNKPTDLVEPTTPEFLHAFSAHSPKNRLGLAQWLVDKRSPTTARVMVNRVWQAMFGAGLVEAPEDFGVRADLPKHPELLDWLAVELMNPKDDTGRAVAPWSLKHIVRTIVSSKTYQQSSVLNKQSLELDPRNQWLARGPRFRVEAEVVRDIALSASGLLHEKVGGPSIFPPVPESFFAQSFLKVDFWNTSPAPDRYRRSLYVFRRRSTPDPALGSFDAPNGDFSCVRRVRSNTPLAALTSLNEPVFVEAAQALALRTLKEGGSTEEERAQFAFQLCTGRKPRKDEVRLMLDLLESRKKKIADGWLAPKEIVLDTPEKMKQLPEGTNPNQAAAWTIVSRVLLNLDESISKN